MKRTHPGNLMPILLVAILLITSGGPAAAARPVTFVPGTVEVAREVSAAVQAAIQSDLSSLPVSDAYAITDARDLGGWQLISVVGLVGIPSPTGWNIIDHGNWFGLVLAERSRSGWNAAAQGAPGFSAALSRIPDSLLSPRARRDLDTKQSLALAGEPYVFPWESGKQMYYGSAAVHDNGFSSVVAGWKAVDFLSDGNTAAGHAPNRLLAATGGTITYKCTPKAGYTSSAVRIGDLFYTHVQNNANLYNGRSFNQGEELGPMKTGTFSENCGYASQGDAWFHVHLGFPNNGTVTFSNWTLNISSAIWSRNGENRGPQNWFTAEGGASACSGPALQSPADGYVSQSQSVSFSWSAPGGCTYSGYTFRIKDTANMESGGSTLVDSGNGGTSNSVTIDALWNNRDLYWGVRTANPLSPNWSVRRFRIEPGSSGCNPGADQVALFVDTNYGGQCLVKGIGDYSNPAAIGLPNDAISSIKVGSSVQALLCRDDNYSGTCETLSSSDANLGDNAIGDNQVSSAKVQSRGSAGTGGTWTAKYYEGDSGWWDPGSLLNATPKCQETLTGLDKNYGSSAPCGGMNGDNWVGDYWATINFPAGNYVFLSDHDDGFKLWLNGSNIAERGGSGSNDAVCPAHALSGNVNLRAMLREQGGDARLKLSWTTDTSLCIQAPGAPGLNNPGPNATVGRYDNVTLSWAATADTMQYNVEFWGGPGVSITQTTAATSLDVGSNFWGGSYSWRVNAENSAGKGSWSETRSLYRKYGTPGSLSALDATSSAISLAWNASADAPGNISGYRIYRNGSPIATVDNTTTGYTDTGLTPETAYTYTVSAYNGTNESDLSAGIQASTLQSWKYLYMPSLSK